MPQLRKAPRVVLDTNIIMDMFHFNDEGTREIYALLLSKRISAITKAECLDELNRVVTYPAFNLTPIEQSDLLRRYGEVVTVYHAHPAHELSPLPRCKDPDDQKFLELAAAIHADILITRDKALLAIARRKKHTVSFAIATPKEAMRLLPHCA